MTLSNKKRNKLFSISPQSRGLADDEYAHEENHDKEDPHEESVHHFSYLLPLCTFGACGSLLSKTVGNILNIAHQFGVHTREATTIAAEHAGAKGDCGTCRWRLFVFRAAGGLLILRVIRDLLVFFAAVTCLNLSISALIFSRYRAGEVASLLSCDVVLGSHPGVLLWLRGLRSGVFLTLPLLTASMVSWFAVGMTVGAVVLITGVFLGGVKRRSRGGGGSRGAVLAHFINTENLGHIVNDEDFSPVGDWFSFCTTEMNVHDEDGERCGGCDHGHCGNIVLP